DLLFKEDIMPNLESIAKAGCVENLDSVLPCQSAAAWTSFYTGKEPDEHEVYSFFEYGQDYKDVSVVDSGSIPDDNFFVELEEEADIYSVKGLMTWPPMLENGFVIPGFLTPGKMSFSGEEPDIDLSGWEEDLDNLSKHVRTARNTSEMLSSRKPALLEICDRNWDLLFMLFSGSDWIQHQLYDRFIEEEEISVEWPHVADYFSDIDDIIGRLDGEEDLDLYVMSDHGMRSFGKIFYINNWLKEKGFLQTGGKEKYWDSKMRLSFLQNKYLRAPIRFLYRSLVLSTGIGKLFGHDPLTRNIRRVLENNLSEKIDFKASKAFVPAEVEGGIHVKDRDTFDELRQELEKENVFGSLEFLEENIGRRKPAILFLQDRYKISTNILGVDFSTMKVNYHDLEGVLITRADEKPGSITDFRQAIS
ncbi:MAG: alkaline phosphatase family protein, partial [Candidatus Nanohaloarchaea archaeon]